MSTNPAKNAYFGYLAQHKHGVFSLLSLNAQRVEFETQDDFVVYLQNGNQTVGQSKITSGKINKTIAKNFVVDTLNKHQGKYNPTSKIEYYFIFECNEKELTELEKADVITEAEASYPIYKVRIHITSNIWEDIAERVDIIGLRHLTKDFKTAYVLGKSLEDISPNKFSDLKITMDIINDLTDAQTVDMINWLKLNFLQIVNKTSQINLMAGGFLYFNNFKKIFNNVLDAEIYYAAYEKFLELVDFLKLHKLLNEHEINLLMLKLKNIYQRSKGLKWTEEKLIEFINQQNINFAVYQKFADIFEVGSKIYAAEKGTTTGGSVYDWT